MFVLLQLVSYIHKRVPLSCRLNELFHAHLRVGVMVIIEESDSTETVKCRTAIKLEFVYFNLCLIVKYLMFNYNSYPFLPLNELIA